jgi:hypothetical protein
MEAIYSPKRHLTFNGLQGVVSQNIELHSIARSIGDWLDLRAGWLGVEGHILIVLTDI